MLSDGLASGLVYSLQKMKYEYHTKLPLESYQNRFWYDSSGNFV